MTREFVDPRRSAAYEHPAAPNPPDRHRYDIRIGSFVFGFGSKHGPADENVYPEENNIIAFNPGTIERGPTGGRGLDLYESRLLFDRKELEGKRVLDLGSGPKAKLARQLANLGITDRVASLSPDYSIAKHAHRVAETGARDLVGGIGEALPFKGGSFDIVLAFFSHIHCKDPVAMVKEVGRVLAPGGVGSIGPCHYPYVDLYSDVLADHATTEYLNSNGIQIENVDIPREVAEFRVHDSRGNAMMVGGSVLRLTRAPEDSIESYSA